MNLDQQALNLFLYMYAMKDDITSFKIILPHINLNNKNSLESFKQAFNSACDSNSKRVLNYILETPLIDNLTTDDFNKAVAAACYKNNAEIMCELLANEKVLEKITFDKKLIFNIVQVENNKAFDVMKCLLEKGKYSISEHGDDIFLLAKDRANEALIEYMFVNTLPQGEQLPKERMYEIILTKQESISPIFLSLMQKLNIEFTENIKDFLKTDKTDLYNILEKKNLFDKLNINLDTKESIRRMKI